MDFRKSTSIRYLAIVALLVIVAISIIVRAGFLMFVKRGYWEQVANRFVKENVVVKPNRGNILSEDGQLMASSLPEYRIYMDFMTSESKKFPERREKDRRIVGTGLLDSPSAKRGFFTRTVGDAGPYNAPSNIENPCHFERAEASREIYAFPVLLSKFSVRRSLHALRLVGMTGVLKNFAFPLSIFIFQLKSGGKAVTGS